MQQHNFDNIDFDKVRTDFSEAQDYLQRRMAHSSMASHEHQRILDDCTFETLDLLKQIKEDSQKESLIETRRFIIQTALSAAALVASVVAAVAAIIALL